jgi:transketolase
MMTSIRASEWIERAQAVASGIRRRVLQHTLKHNEGYLSQACSSAEILATLYTRTLRLGPLEAPFRPGRFSGVPGPNNPHYTPGAIVNGPRGPEYDRFVFSPVHYALALYATLIEVGRLAADALDEFNQDGSTVEMIGAEHSPGIETTAGSLAQALSQAAGIALARKRRGDTGRVWVMMSDGEFEEGQTWEAIANAAFYRLDNLRVVVDANGQQCDGEIGSVALLEPLADRIVAFGASVVEVNGNDLIALAAAMERPAVAPHVVLARTDPTYGLPILAERRPLLHTVRLTTEEERARYREAYEAMLR